MIDEQNAIYLRNRWWFLNFEDRSTLVVNSAFTGAIGLSNEERVAVKASSFFLSLIIIQVPGFLKKVFRKFFSTFFSRLESTLTSRILRGTRELDPLFGLRSSIQRAIEAFAFKRNRIISSHREMSR